MGKSGAKETYPWRRVGLETFLRNWVYTSPWDLIGCDRVLKDLAHVIVRLLLIIFAR